MSLIIISHSTIVTHALENSAVKHFESVKIFNRLDAIEVVGADIEAIVFDMSAIETDVPELLQFELRCPGGLAKLVLMTREDQNMVLAVSLAGKAYAILPHSSEADEIMRVARALHGGLSIIPTDMLPMLREAKPRPRSLGSSAVLSLTPRQEAVLAMLAEGQSNKMIARALGINDTTVRVHVRAVLQKLGVSNRTQAALAASQYVSLQN